MKTVVSKVKIAFGILLFAMLSSAGLSSAYNFYYFQNPATGYTTAAAGTPTAMTGPAVDIVNSSFNPTPTASPLTKQGNNVSKKAVAVPSRQEIGEKDVLEELNESRALLKEKESALTVLRSRGNLTEQQKAEFMQTAIEFANASFEERIKAANLLESKGANIAVVLNFITFAENKQAKLGNVTTLEQLRAIVKEFDTGWNKFRTAVSNDVLSDKLSAAVERGEQALDRMDTAIKKMKDRGKNVTQLESFSKSIRTTLGSIMNATTLKRATWRLDTSYRGLSQLAKAIQYTLNGKPSLIPAQLAEPASFAGDVEITLSEPEKNPVDNSDAANDSST